MNRSTLLPCAVILFLAGCSSTPDRKVVNYPAGDKASVDQLTYNIIDTQIVPRLGDEANARIPKSRFYIVDLSVSNSGNAELSIPALTLVDDAGKTYGELADGSGVPHWLGVLRKVQPNQTEQGGVVFDAPAGHYKLRLTDETDAADVFVDIPLSFAHEMMQTESQATSDAISEATSGAAAPPDKKKK